MEVLFFAASVSLMGVKTGRAGSVLMMSGSGCLHLFMDDCGSRDKAGIDAPTSTGTGIYKTEVHIHLSCIHNYLKSKVE